MKLVTKRNTTAFTTRSLVRVVKIAFERAGVNGSAPKTLSFRGGRFGISFDRGEQVSGDAFGRTGRVVVREGKWATFYIDGERTADDLYRAARVAGRALRGVGAVERNRGWQTMPSDEVVGRAFPLVLKKAPPRKRGNEGPADKLAKRLARCVAYATRARERMKRAQAALKRLERKQRRLEKLLKKHEGEQGT